MFLKCFKIKSALAVKIISVILAAVMLMGIIPNGQALGIFRLSALAEGLPSYDPTLGEFTEEDGVLIATPYENCGFRGWYSNAGEEVSINKSFTIPNGKNADDYFPVFYNLNLLENAGFEENFYQDWYSVSGNGIFALTSSNIKSGSKSLEIKPQNSAFYYSLNELEQNNQYTVKFYYKAAESLKFVSIISGDDVNDYANLYAGKFIAHCSQNNLENNYSSTDWNQVSITFFTAENTTVKLAMLYDDDSLFIDDMSLVKNVMDAPTYFNNEFETFNLQSGADNTYLNFNHSKADYTKAVITEDGRLKVTSTRNTNIMYSDEILFKKGAEYTFKATVDISEFEHKWVPKLDSNGNQVFDENGNMIYEQVTSNGQLVDMVNWINFSFSTQKGIFGDAANDTYVTSNSSQNSPKMVVLNKSGTVLVTRTSKYSGFGFGIESIKNTSDRGELDVTITFVSEKTCVGYFNIRNNGCETFYIDNISLEEDYQNIDVKSVVENFAIKTVGTAIRTEGKQGIRHKTSLDKVFLTADNKYGIRFTEYGTIAIKNEYLGENELVLDGEYNFGGKIYSAKKGVAYSFEEKIDKVFSKDDYTTCFTAVLINIAKQNWNNDYTVRAYFKYLDKNGNENVIYVNPFDVAVYPVAKLAYSAKNQSGEYTESEQVREYLLNNIITFFADKTVTVSNNAEPIYSNFQGISSTVYHGTAFFPDSHGRTYTEQQAAIEMDRLKDSKVNNVRTRFASQWMWTANGWDWDSTKMTAFYKWAKMLDDRDISVTLNAGWSIRDFIYYFDYNKNNNANNYEWVASNPGHSSIPEVDYLHGVGNNLYGEDAKAAEIKAYLNFDLTDAEMAHFSVVAARYAEWVKQALNALKAHGVNNVEYIIPFTENGYSMESKGDNTFCYDEWLMVTSALHSTLTEEGIRDNYKIIGPCQSIYAYQNRKIPFIEYIYSKISGTDFANMLDINAMHQYTKPNTRAGYKNTVYDPVASYSYAEENFPYYSQILNNAGVADMEFWCDEYFAHSPDAKWWNNVGMQMTQFAAGLTAGINNGVNRFLTWQMFDTLWDSEATHGTAIHDNASEFSGGIHAVGTCPSLVHVDGKTCPKGENCPCTKNYNISSYTPRVTYYGINLLGKYLNNENAKVLATEVVNNDTDFEGGVYVSTIKNDNDKIVILVVNTMPTVSSVDICLDDMPNAKFKRYVYNPDEIIPTAEAISIPSDGTVITDKNSTFYQIVPAGSFAIFVHESEYFGNDFELDMGEDD